MKILGTLALLWLITFAKANEDQSNSSNEEATEESSAAQYSSSSSTSSSSSLQEQKSLSQEQESNSRTSSQTVTSKHETDKKTKFVKENNNRQPGQPESVWIGDTPDSKAYDIIEIDNKNVDSRTSSQTVTSKHETDNKRKAVKENSTRQPGRPESVWIGETPDSKTYDIVEVDNKNVDSRTSSQTDSSKHETDKKTKFVKENNNRQPGQPESVWIGDTPDSKTYDIVEVDNKNVDSRTASQTVTSKHETDNKTKVVKENNSRQPGRPESVWIGDTPDSKTYDIFEVDNKNVDSRTSSQTVSSKHETDKKTKVVKENNNQQPGQPESVWIGDTPDSKTYDIVEVDNKNVDSRTASQTVISKHETENKTKAVKENNNRQPGRPESVWIGNTPDSKTYDIVEVDNKNVDSRTSSQTVSSKHETEKKTKFVKENNNRQPGRPESVWIGDTPDSKTYDIFEVDNKNVDSRTSSQTVSSKHETDKKTKVVKENNNQQPGQPESVWIGDTPDSKTYDIVEVDNKNVDSRTASQTVTSKHETDNKKKVVKQNNTRQPGRPESVWIGDTPDSKTYDIFEVDNKNVDSRTSSQTDSSKHETDKKSKFVKENNTGQSGQPESVWVGDTPDPNEYDQIIDVSKSDKTTTSPPTQSYPDQSLPPGYNPTISPSPDQPRNTEPGPIIHPTPGQPPMPIPYPPTQTNPPGPKTPIQPQPDQPLNPGPKPINQPTPAQPIPIPYPPTQINPPGPKPLIQPKPDQPPNPGPKPISQPTPAQPIPYPPTQYNPPGPKPPIQLNPDQLPNPGPGPIIHPTPAQPPVPISNSPSQPNPVKRKCRRPRKPKPQQPDPGFDVPVKPPISVWFGETPDPKDYTIYYINKDTENDECDDYDESSEGDTSVTETDASATETDTSVTETDNSLRETDKYVKALQFQLNLNTVFGVGRNGECHCTCTSTKPPYFISIPRDKIKGYLD